MEAFFTCRVTCLPQLKQSVAQFPITSAGSCASRCHLEVNEKTAAGSLAKKSGKARGKSGQTLQVKFCHCSISSIVPADVMGVGHADYCICV